MADLPDRDEIRIRKNEALVFAIALLAFAWFQRPALHDNELTRLNLTYAIVLHHTLAIDAYHENTMDKALRNGHYYCDKAPGLSFAAAPALFLITNAFRGLDFYPGNLLVAWMLTVLTGALPCALACMLLYRMLRREAGDAAAACGVAFALLGTIFFIYAGLFYSHAPSGALLVFALYLAAAPVKQGARPTASALFACGLLIGCATATEYTALAPGLAVAAVAARSAGARRAAFWIAAGALLPAAGLAAYNTAAFGSPLSIGYFHETDAYFKEQMSRGLGGVTWPRPAALAAILASPTRGLLWSAPVLVFAIPGCVAGYRRGGAARTLCAAGAAGFMLLLIIVSGYYEPFGGHTPGPRFLVPALPLLAAPLAFAWRALSRPWRVVYLGSGLASLYSIFLLAAGEPHAPLALAAPIRHFSWPLMIQGYFAGNLADMAGAPPMIALVLFALIITAALFALMKRNPDPPGAWTLAGGAAAGAALFALLMAAGAAAGKPGREAHAEYARAWARRGYQAYHAGLFRDMERCLIMSVKNDPLYIQPYVSLGAFYIHKAGRPDLARPLLEQAESAAFKTRDPLLPSVLELRRAAGRPAQAPKGDGT